MPSYCTSGSISLDLDGIAGSMPRSAADNGSEPETTIRVGDGGGQAGEYRQELRRRRRDPEEPVARAGARRVLFRHRGKRCGEDHALETDLPRRGALERRREAVRDGNRRAQPGRPRRAPPADRHRVSGFSPHRRPQRHRERGPAIAGHRCPGDGNSRACGGAAAMARPGGTDRELADGPIQRRTAARRDRARARRPPRPADRRRADRSCRSTDGIAARAGLRAGQPARHDGADRYPRHRLCRAVRQSALPSGARDAAERRSRRAMIRMPFLIERSRLPLARRASGWFLPWIAALSVYLAVLGGIGLVALGDSMRGWDASLAQRASLQLPPDASTARINTALALL